VRTLVYILGFGVYLSVVVLGLLLGLGTADGKGPVWVVVPPMFLMGGMFGFFASTREKGQGNFSLLLLVILALIGLVAGVPGWGMYLTGYRLADFI